MTDPAPPCPWSPKLPLERIGSGIYDADHQFLFRTNGFSEAFDAKVLNWIVTAINAQWETTHPREKPTIAELEAILSAPEGQYKITMLPDGQIRAIDTHAPVNAHSAPPSETFQFRVQPWLVACFGEEIAVDVVERNHRFLEESLELVQSCGCTQSEAHQLVNYVYGRPVGDAEQEVGGVMNTLAALCLARGIDMHDAAEKELARVWTKIEKIRAKQAAKPKHSPLPEAAPADADVERVARAIGDVLYGYCDPSDTPNTWRTAMSAARAALAAMKGDA